MVISPKQGEAAVFAKCVKVILYPIHWKRPELAFGHTGREKFKGEGAKED